MLAANIPLPLSVFHLYSFRSILQVFGCRCHSFAFIFCSYIDVGTSTLDIQYIWLGVALWTVALTGSLLAVDPSCACVEVKAQSNELTRGTIELVQNFRL
jgi:hypothetical protein